MAPNRAQSPPARSIGNVWTEGVRSGVAIPSGIVFVVPLESSDTTKRVARSAWDARTNHG